MNTETALEITKKWANDRPTVAALASTLAGLIPEPDKWALNEESRTGELFSLTGRSIFVVTYVRPDRLSVQRAIVTNDGDTQISVSDKTLGARNQWDRRWTFRFEKRSPDFPEQLKWITTPTVGDAGPVEELSRAIAQLADWPVGEPQRAGA